MTGVTFTAVIDGNVQQTITSDANGIITYQVYGQNNKKVTYIKLADERYTTEEEARIGHEKAIEYVKNVLE